MVMWLQIEAGMRMNILPESSGGPVGAVALLAFADPVEEQRFTELENAVWGETTLAPAIVESVRLLCAQVRGCEFCAAVRTSSAVDDGLTESQISRLSQPSGPDVFSPEQAAALTLADSFLCGPEKPETATEIASLLGPEGVLEVLLACCAFASAELRIALGENLPPEGSGVMQRERGNARAHTNAAEWPSLDGAVLDPAFEIPHVAERQRKIIRARLESLWSGEDLSEDLLAACILRNTQLHSVSEDEPVFPYLLPARAAKRVDADTVRDWPNWSPQQGRFEMALAEQLWIDPSGVDEAITEPLRHTRDTAGIIRLAWQLILIGQLQRLALVLHRDR